MTESIWIDEGVTYNVGNQGDTLVDELVDMMCNPELWWIALNEIGDQIERVELAARMTGWTFLYDDSEPSSHHIGMLVAPQVGVVKFGLRKLSPRTYVGKKTAGARDNGWAEAKYLLWAKLRVDDKIVRRAVVHLVPSAMRKGNWRTKALHGLQVAGCVSWLVLKGDRILCGDLNAALNKKRERPLLRRLAKVCHLYALPTHGKRAIDVFCVRKRPGVRRANYSVAFLKRRNSNKPWRSDHRPTVLRRRRPQVLVAHPLGDVQ